MALSEQRYEDIDASLRDMNEYLLALSTELVESTSLSGMRSHLYQMIINSANQLAHLRVTFEIARDLESNADE